jgi:hypothetical protein
MVGAIIFARALHLSCQLLHEQLAVQNGESRNAWCMERILLVTILMDAVTSAAIIQPTAAAVEYPMWPTGSRVTMAPKPDPGLKL